MGTLKLKTPSGGSVSFVGQDSALDTTIVVPTGNATMVTDVALATGSGAGLVGVTPVGVLTATNIQAALAQIASYMAAHP